jgi:hypothetical protein
MKMNSKALPKKRATWSKSEGIEHKQPVDEYEPRMTPWHLSSPDIEKIKRDE